MDDHLIPAGIRAKISELGFHPVSFIPLYKFWSVVGILNGEHYNIQLCKDDLKVDSIHLLEYLWNASGAKILKVKRGLVQQKRAVLGNI